MRKPCRKKIKKVPEHEISVLSDTRARWITPGAISHAREVGQGAWQFPERLYCSASHQQVRHSPGSWRNALAHQAARPAMAAAAILRKVAGSEVVRWDCVCS